MIHRVVTGASGFLGSALVRHLTGVPGRVLAIDRSASRLNVPLVMLDCRDRNGLADVLGPFLQGADRVELYEAAGLVPPLARIAEIDPGTFRETVSHNLDSAYGAASSFAEVARTLDVRGSIVFLGSVGGCRSHRYQIAYDAAAAGVESLARGFALEYGPSGLTTRVAAVGPVAESPTTLADGVRAPGLVRLVPRGRYASRDEIVRAVAALGSEALDVANGAVVPLDGGLVQQLRPADRERPPAVATQWA